MNQVRIDHNVFIPMPVTLVGCLLKGKANFMAARWVSRVNAHLGETLYSSSIACAAEGQPTPSGAYMVDTMLANVGKHNATRFHFEVARLATYL